MVRKKKHSVSWVGVAALLVVALFFLHSQGLLSIGSGSVYAPVWGSVTCKEGATSPAPIADFSTPNSNSLTFHCPSEDVQCAISMRQSKFYPDDQCWTHNLEIKSSQSGSGWYGSDGTPYIASNTPWEFPDEITIAGGQSITFTAGTEVGACQGWDKVELFYRKTAKVTHYDDARNAPWDALGCTRSEILQKLASNGERVYGDINGLDARGIPASDAKVIASDSELSGLHLDESVTFVSYFEPIKTGTLSTYKGESVYCRTGPSGSYIYSLKNAGGYNYADPTSSRSVECCFDDSYSCPPGESCSAEFTCEKEPSCDWLHPCQGESCRLIEGQPTFFNEQCVDGQCKMQNSEKVDCCTKADCPSEMGCDTTTHTCKDESQRQSVIKHEQNNNMCNGVCENSDLRKTCEGGIMINGVCAGGTLVPAQGACPNDCINCLPWEEKTGNIGAQTCHIPSSNMPFVIGALVLLGLGAVYINKGGKGSNIGDPLSAIGLGGM